MAIQFDDLLFAFEFVSGGPPFAHEAYLCRATGVIHYHSEYDDPAEPLPHDIDDSTKYVAIPHKNDLDLGKRLALRFVEEMLPDSLNDACDMFRRKGAYARFRDLLERRDALQQWHDYQNKHTSEALRRWCADNGIDVEG